MLTEQKPDTKSDPRVKRECHHQIHIYKHTTKWQQKNERNLFWFCCIKDKFEIYKECFKFASLLITLNDLMLPFCGCLKMAKMPANIANNSRTMIIIMYHLLRLSTNDNTALRVIRLITKDDLTHYLIALYVFFYSL